MVGNRVQAFEGFMGSYHGKLKAEIQGEIFDFDGDTWTGPEGEPLRLLNEAVDYVPLQHYSIDEVARNVLEFAGLNAIVLRNRGG